MYVFGLVAIFASWAGSSGSASWNAQMLWLVLGITGLVCAHLGTSGWLFTALRQVRAREVDLLAPCLVEESSASTATSARTDPALPGSTQLVTAERMTRFHRPDCLLVAGKPTQAYDERDGRVACGACLP